MPLRFPARLALRLTFVAFMAAIVAGNDNDDVPEPSCGDCWCVPEQGQECPDFDGLRQEFPTEWISALQSFERLESPDDIALEPAGCFPFGAAIPGQIDVTRYPEAAGPPCQVPSSTTDTTVCAFVFPNGKNGTETCQGRSYRVQTFDSQEAAMQHHNDTATTLIVHKGACGVCSNAVDLAGRAETLVNMNSINVVCASDYVVSADRSTRFEKLIDCYAKASKLTRPCATLWAHFGATNGELCAEVCVPNSDFEILLNDPDKDCALSKCLNCSATQFEAEFNTMAGLYKSIFNAGMLDPVTYPCDVFYRIQDEAWDPCVGAVPGSAVRTKAPVTSAASSWTRVSLWSMTIAFLTTTTAWTIL